MTFSLRQLQVYLDEAGERGDGRPIELSFDELNEIVGEINRLLGTDRSGPPPVENIVRTLRWHASGAANLDPGLQSLAPRLLLTAAAELERLQGGQK